MNTMNDAFYDFAWRVAPRYEWQDWLDQKGKPVVVPCEGSISLEDAEAVELVWKQAQEEKEKYGPVLHEAIEHGTEVRRYCPMQRQHAALFREFAGLDYFDKASILDFAGKYGGLGVPPQHQSLRVPDENGELRDHFAQGEPYLSWALEICLMREGLRLESRKRRSLNDLRRSKWLFDRHLQHVQGRLGFDRAGEPRLTLEPLTLIAAMWLQLALAITGDKSFVACKFCRRPFEISTDPTGFRSHREFCSNSCKTKDYRKRKRTALWLAANGKGVADISVKTSTEVTTVRAWLASAKASRKVRLRGDV